MKRGKLCWNMRGRVRGRVRRQVRWRVRWHVGGRSTRRTGRLRRIDAVNGHPVRSAKAVRAAGHLWAGWCPLSAHACGGIFHRKVVIPRRRALGHALHQPLVRSNGHAAARGVERAASAPHLAADAACPSVPGGSTPQGGCTMRWCEHEQVPCVKPTTAINAPCTPPSHRWTSAPSTCPAPLAARISFAYTTANRTQPL